MDLRIKCTYIHFTLGGGSRGRKGGSHFPEGWLFLTGTVAQNTPDYSICRTLASCVEETLGEPAKFYGFAAVDDAAFLNRAGIPAVSIGPGSLTVAHAPNEHVEIRELLDCARIYALTMLEWCGF